jgi:lactam utilization protein B
VDGSEMDFRVDTLLVHGDTPNAIELCKAIRAELTKMGVEITSFGNFV